MKLIQVGKFLIAIFSLFILDLRCSTPVNSDKNLKGKYAWEIIDKLGKPNKDTIFLLTKNLYEYEYGLLVYYPHPEKTRIFIKEMVWQKKNIKTVVWYHSVNGQWKSLDYMIWDADKIKY